MFSYVLKTSVGVLASVFSFVYNPFFLISYSSVDICLKKQPPSSQQNYPRCLKGDKSPGMKRSLFKSKTQVLVLFEIFSSSLPFSQWMPIPTSWPHSPRPRNVWDFPPNTPTPTCRNSLFLIYLLHNASKKKKKSKYYVRKKSEIFKKIQKLSTKILQGFYFNFSVLKPFREGFTVGQDITLVSESKETFYQLIAPRWATQDIINNLLLRAKPALFHGSPTW